LSIKSKLVFITFVFTVIIIMLMGMNYFVMDTLSTVRAYVGGEAFWSKGQKDAIYFLARYTHSHNEEEYKNYLNSLKIPLGDRIARLELQKEIIDYGVVDAGFIQGKNHPEDVRAMAHLFKRFHFLSYLQKSIQIWTQGDLEIDKLQIVGNQIHELILKNKLTPELSDQYLAKIYDLNKTSTFMEDQYSYTLGEAARWLTSVLYWLIFSMALLFLAFGLFVSIIILNGILKNIELIRLGTIRVEQGSLLTPIEVYNPKNSKDELNQLAQSFNIMTESLSRAISERDTARKKLETRARQLSEAQELAHMGNWDWDIQHNKLSSSEEIYRIFGLMPEDEKFTFEYFLERIHSSDREATNAIFNKSLVDKKPFSIDCQVQLENGDIRELNIHGTVVVDHNGVPIKLIGYTQDISERYMIQNQLIQSSKMASLGEMAGGIAHEINNPLAIIKLAAAQLQKFLEFEKPNFDNTKQAILRIDNTVDRISKIVQGLRVFSRDGRSDPFEDVSVAILLENTLSFCNERFKYHSVKLIKDHPVEDLVFEGRQVEISQVLLNLLNNATDAIESLEDKWIQIAVKTQGKYLEMRIIDSGNGIPIDIQEKMFQPFFTSKEIGKGTGFGLSLSQTIIKGHKGELLFDKEHINTCFILRIPLKQTETN
jgi:signal transduction histidine kinase/HAMP domain-containing protein